MNCDYCHGLRGRLVLLLSLAVLPGMAVNLHQALAAMRSSEVRAAGALVDTLGRLQSSFAREIDRTGPDLSLADGRTEGGCSAALALVLAQDRHYTDVGMLGGDGQVRCSSGRHGVGATRIEPGWAQAALRKDGQPLAVLSKPPGQAMTRLVVLQAQSGNPAGSMVNYAAADLVVALGLAAVALPNKARLLVFDAQGHELPLDSPDARRAAPDPMARIVSTPAIRRRLALANEPISRRIGDQWITMVPLGEHGEAGSAALIIRGADLYHEAWAALISSVLSMLLGLLLLLLLLRWVTMRLIMAPASALTRTAEALGRGELEARTGVTRGADEFSKVAIAFDRMAQDIQQRSEENQRHMVALERLNRLHTVLAEVNEAILRRTHASQLMSDICRIACHTGGFSHVWIGEVNAEGQTLSVVSWESSMPTDIWTDFSISLDPATDQGRGYVAEAVRSGKPAGSNRFRDDPRTERWHAAAIELDIASSLILPLGTTSTGVRRVLALHATAADYFNATEIRLLEQVAQDAALGLSLINTENRLAHSTTHDAVTGLPNAKLLMQRLREVLRQAAGEGQMVVVCVLDVGIQAVSNALGLRQSNTLLRALGDQIEASLDVHDTAGVLPGERIALVISDVATMDKAASRLQRKLEQARAMLSGSVATRVRAGVATFPQDGEDVEELIDKALSALDLAHAEDAEPINFFAPDLNRVLRENRALQDRLHGAIERGELSLHYQPIVSLRTGLLSGFEALLRWRHPELGNIPPDRFIPLAEGSGLINEIGEWLLQQVARQANAWDCRATSGLFISVNVSAIQLRDVHFADRIGKVLDDCYSRTGRVRIAMEVTESHLLKDVEKSIMLLRRLGGLGIEIILDDFGTGYSSLSYLHRLPLHVLKIDKSFTRDITTNPLGRKMVAGIQALAQSLGLETVVEGIESIEQQELVNAIGCSYAQGFFYDRGLPVEEVQRKWLPLPT